MDPTESIGDSAEGEVTQADEQEMMVRMMQMLSAQLGKTEEVPLMMVYGVWAVLIYLPIRSRVVY